MGLLAESSLVRGPLEPFIPDPDARERHAVTVRAPAALVLDVACRFDFQSVVAIRAIFRLREIVMRARSPQRRPRGFLEEMRALGWGSLLERPGELVVFGAVCRPWLAEVVFRPLAAEGFASFAEPDLVKIAWTLEAYALSADQTRLVTETRVVATDERARKRFRRYWRWARFGIVAIRWLLLPAIRRQAEKEWKERSRHRAPSP